ncbi:hypothetical protein Tco_0258297, partial [Tanacetum coccineum]
NTPRISLFRCDPIWECYKEDDESYASEFADSMLNDDVDDSGTRIEPRSHKENPKVFDDDDVNDKQKQDQSKDDNIKKMVDTLQQVHQLLKNQLLIFNISCI